MSSLSQLRREKARLLKYKSRDDERARLKSDIFNLKYGGKIDAVRNIAGKFRGFADGYAGKKKSKNPFGKGSVFNPGSVW